MLQGITPSKEFADSWSWIPNKITGFSVKTCYEILQKSASSSSLEVSQKKAINKLWKSGAPSKINVFGWRLFLDRLPTKSALSWRHCWHRTLSTTWTAAEGKGKPENSLLDLASYSLEHLAIEECYNFQRGRGWF